MLFQKEKDYGNTITKIGRKKNKKNETAKKKRKIKKERKCSLKNRILASSMVRRISNLFLNTSSEKVSFCALNKKASLALETALVLPMFLLGMVTMISFMDIYRIQTEHLQALCEKTKEAGMYAYVLDGKGPEEITLPDVYAYTPIGAFVPLPKVWMHNTVKVHAWIGADETAFSGETREPEEMVYVTETGTVYHKKAGCRYLKVSINQISGSSLTHARNDSGQKYSPVSYTHLTLPTT